MCNSYAIGINIYGKEHRFEMNGIKNIWCPNLKLKTLTVYDEDNLLKRLFCHENKLESLTIIGGKNIKCIECWGGNNNLKELDVSMCEKLKYLNCNIELENGLILPNHQLKCVYYE